MPTGLKRQFGFTASDNTFFAPDKKLAGLIHQQKLDLRGIIQSYQKYSGRAQFNSTEIADLLVRQGDAITKVNAYYKKAINNERKKSPVIS